MERGKKTGFILRQFKRKSKRLVNKDYFTEFFYFNKSRGVIEFLEDENDVPIIENFFKEFIPQEFRDFIQLKILNDEEEPINSWYVNKENLVLVIIINWGIKKQEISIDVDIDSFLVTSLSDEAEMSKDVDFTLFNDHIISFLTTQARTLAESFDKISNK